MAIDWDVKLVSHNNLVVCHVRDEEALDTLEMSGFVVASTATTCTIQADDRAVVAHLLTTKGYRVEN